VTSPEGEPKGEELRERLAEMGRYHRVASAHEHGLVILAMGIPYWLMPMEEGGYGLFVEKQHEAAVREQFRKYDRENRYWPPSPDLLPAGSGAGWSVALYALLIWGFFFIQNQHLLESGSAMEGEILAGQWWRSMTALTLHGDWAHLVGNTLGGWLFFGLVLRYFGHGLSWVLILVSGMLGNLLNAWGYAGTGHNSIGASTAVFGGLGIVVGFRLLRQFRLSGWEWPRQLWVPVVAGLALLGFLGAGGERTDVLAHWWGFLVGAALGAGAGYFELNERLKGNKSQSLLGWLTIIAVIGAWVLALR